MAIALIVSAVSLIIGATGVLLVDCSSSVLNLFANDPISLCAGVESMGIVPAPWMGIALLAVGLLGIVGAWAPTDKRRAKRADKASISALQRNLNRVETGAPAASSEPEPVVADNTDDVVPEDEEEDDLAELEALVEVLRHRFERAEELDGELLQTWIASLRVCNDLFESGRLAPEDFIRLNRGLLDIAAEPVATANVG